ncbi:MAG TPA: ABC transporter substrate-binding protein [Candidatus Eisenbacteria bacterium]
MRCSAARPLGRSRRAAGAALAAAVMLAAAAVAAPSPTPPAATPPAATPPAATPPAAAPPAAAPPAPAESGRRYPLRRAAELKARLLERAPDAPLAALAAEYVTSPEVARLDPVARAAEELWAARIGLQGNPTGDERKTLRTVVDRLEGCPIDSVALRRAEIGLTKIGVVVPLSGKYERYGKTFVNGLRMAVDEHSRAYVPPVSLILYDSEADPLVGARKARWLLKDHGVSLLVGELFTASTAPLAAATQVVGAVLLSPSAPNERLAILGDGVFQLHVPPVALASALVRAAKDVAPKPALAVLASQSSDDSLAVDAIVAAAQTEGVRLAGIVRVPDSAIDLTTTIASLKGKKGNVLAILGGDRLVGIAAPQVHSEWPAVQVIGLESLDPEGLNHEARAALEGASFIISDYAIQGAPADSFASRYQRAYKEPPTRMSVRGYLAGLAITRALEAGCVNAAGLKEALRTQLYDTPEGRRLRALKPVIAAEPERLTIRGGRAVAP